MHQLYPIAVGHCMIASEISVCLNQGNGLQAARLSSRDGGSRETLGEEEAPRLGNSQDSLTARFQRVPSESSRILSGGHFYLPNKHLVRLCESNDSKET